MKEIFIKLGLVKEVNTEEAVALRDKEAKQVQTYIDEYSQ